VVLSLGVVTLCSIRYYLTGVRCEDLNGDGVIGIATTAKQPEPQPETTVRVPQAPSVLPTPQQLEVGARLDLDGDGIIGKCCAAPVCSCSTRIPSFTT
jgi:hypothetical protein